MICQICFFLTSFEYDIYNLRKMTSKDKSKRPQKIQAQKLIGQVIHRYKAVISDKESIFYALAVGFSRDPLREQDFKYTSQVHEDFVAFPLVGTVAHHTNFIEPLLQSPNMPIFNPNVIRHAQQKFIMVKDHLDLSLEYEHETTITDCIDKGKNAIIWFQVKTFTNAQGKRQLICVCQQSLFLFGLGGFGFKGLNLYPAPIQIPKKNPDIVTKVETFPNQAFYYRLTGDRNPLHIDPKIAVQQKLERPIIHGMATYGSVARVFVQEVLKNDHLKFKSLHTRFVGHVYPGEALKLNFWKVGENTYAFDAETVDRKTKVLVGAFQTRSAAKL